MKLQQKAEQRIADLTAALELAEYRLVINQGAIATDLPEAKPSPTSWRINDRQP
jgi:hypothetical protein